MVALLPRRAALAAVLVAGSLAMLAALIVWQTADPPTTEGTDVGEPAPDISVPDPGASPSVTATRGAATPPFGASSAPAAESVESERALAAEIRAFVESGQIGKARARANAYYERFPHGPSTAELERLTGAHPRRDATDTRP
jgi:hypothetical protein